MKVEESLISDKSVDMNMGKVIVVDNDDLSASSFEVVFQSLGCKTKKITDESLLEDALISADEAVSLVILAVADNQTIKSIDLVKAICPNSKIAVSSYQPEELVFQDDIILMHKPARLSEVKDLFISES